MNSERHYPAAFKFMSVAMMAFAVWIFHQSKDYMVKIYAVIEFVATLNGWAASENDNNTYGDLFLLNDACCSACFFLTMLDLAQGRYDRFYIYSFCLFVLYFLWNRLLISTGNAKKDDLQRYQICNIGGIVYSAFAAKMQFVAIYKYMQVVHYIGMTAWIGILSFWFLDTYFSTHKKAGELLVPPQEEVIVSEADELGAALTESAQVVKNSDTVKTNRRNIGNNNVNNRNKKNKRRN